MTGMFGSQCGDPCECSPAPVCSPFEDCYIISDYADGNFATLDCPGCNIAGGVWNGQSLIMTSDCIWTYMNAAQVIGKIGSFGKGGVYAVLTNIGFFPAARLTIYNDTNCNGFGSPLTAVWVGHNPSGMTGVYTAISGCSTVGLPPVITPATLTVAVCPP